MDLLAHRTRQPGPAARRGRDAGRLSPEVYAGAGQRGAALASGWSGPHEFLLRGLLATDAEKTLFGWQHDISVALERIGDLRLQTGDAAAALEAYSDGLAIRRRLAEADPHPGGARRDISI